MSDLPSTLSKVQVESTRFRSAASESVVQQMGSSINALIDDKATQDAAIAALQGKVFSKLVTSFTLPTLFSVTLAADEIVQAVAGHAYLPNTASGNGVGSSGLIIEMNGSPAIAEITRNGVPIYTFANGINGTAKSVLSNIVLDQPGAGTWTYAINVTSGSLIGVTGRIMVTKLKAGLP